MEPLDVTAHGRSVAAGWTHDVPCDRCLGIGLVCPDIAGHYDPDPDTQRFDDCKTCGNDRYEHAGCPDCRGAGTATRPGLAPVAGSPGDG